MISKIKCIVLFAILFPCTTANEEDRNARAFSGIKDKLHEMRREVHNLHREIKTDLGHSSNAIYHLEESLAQAFDSAQDIAKSIHQKPTPLIGELTKRHVIREIAGQILQVIGTYGLLIFLGSISYYAVTGLFVSGGLLATFFISIPALLTSALFFPPLLIMLELMFGLSYLMGSMSIDAMIAAFNSFGFFMMHPLMLEYVGMATLAIGMLSSLFQYRRKSPEFRY